MRFGANYFKQECNLFVVDLNFYTVFFTVATGFP